MLDNGVLPDVDFLGREPAVELDEIIGRQTDRRPVRGLDELNLAVRIPDHSAVFVGQRPLLCRVQRLLESLNTLHHAGAKHPSNPLRMSLDLAVETCEVVIDTVADDALDNGDRNVVLRGLGARPIFVGFARDGLSRLIGPDDTKAQRSANFCRLHALASKMSLLLRTLGGFWTALARFSISRRRVRG